MHGFGRTNAAVKPSSPDGSFELGDRCGGVLHRKHRGAEQSRRVGRAVRGEPVVVRLCDRHRRLGVGYGPGVEADRRVENGLVDPFFVHVGQAQDRVGPAGLSLRRENGTWRSPRSPIPGWRECLGGRRVSRSRPRRRARSRTRSRVITGRCLSGMSAQASGGSTTCPSASTTLCGLVRGGPELTPPRLTPALRSRRRPPVVALGKGMAEHACGVAGGDRAQLVVGQVPERGGQHRPGCRARSSRRAGSRSRP